MQRRQQERGARRGHSGAGAAPGGSCRRCLGCGSPGMKSRAEITSQALPRGQDFGGTSWKQQGTPWRRERECLGWEGMLRAVAESSGGRWGWKKPPAPRAARRIPQPRSSRTRPDHRCPCWDPSAIALCHSRCPSARRSQIPSCSPSGQREWPRPRPEQKERATCQLFSQSIFH